MTKRTLDVVLAALLLVPLLPVWLVTAVVIKLDSRGPVFYRGVRAGRLGQPFVQLKFRTMVPRADEMGPGLTARRDARLTRVGPFLRRWKLDETPQLLNVLKGEMSLVGPRPEVLSYVECYTEEQRGVLVARPGITSPATVAFRHEERLLDVEDPGRYYADHVLPEKLRIDLAYLQHQSAASDLGVLLHTVRALARR